MTQWYIKKLRFCPVNFTGSWQVYARDVYVYYKVKIIFRWDVKGAVEDDTNGGQDK